VTCALCGFNYSEAQACRPACPMSRGCTLVCCPNCGHGVARDGVVAATLRKLLVKLSTRRPA